MAVAVEVWWGRPDQELPWHHTLLDPTEQGRRGALRRAADQARFTVATALVKLVVAERLGVAAAGVVIDRSCTDCGRPHGRPRLPGRELAVSISHSGDRVLVAVTDGPAVGADVEQVAPVNVAELATQVLGPGETAAALPDFFRYWTRKEAVVKATGDGLRMPLAQVMVAPPDAPATLLRYGDRRDLAASMADLSPGDGYAAAVAVLAAGPLRLCERDGSSLLAG